MLKTHHKMRWNREFQYLPAKIIRKIGKYQYILNKTIHFSLHLTLSSLFHIPLSPLIPVSITLCHSWTAPIWIYSHASLQRADLKAGYSSVRASVHASVPLLREAQNLCFCNVLSEISKNHICILQYLAPIALKTYHHRAYIGQERSCAGCSRYLWLLKVPLTALSSSRTSQLPAQPPWYPAPSLQPLGNNLTDNSLWRLRSPPTQSGAKMSRNPGRQIIGKQVLVLFLVLCLIL